jgi:hypothetical protein
MSSESKLVTGLIETSFGDIARRDPVTTTSCKAVSFATAGAVCAYAGPTAVAAAAASTARTAYCSLVFPIMFSLGFENDPKLCKQRAAFIPQPLHLYEDYNMPPDGWEAI